MTNSRNKGAVVEREFALLAYELTGKKLLRALAQCRSGGHDLDGLPGWAIEVKARAERPGPGELARMWAQTVDQAQRVEARPILAVKVNRRGWICYVDAHDLRPDWWEPGQAWAALEPEDFFHMVRSLEEPV
jgi:Holliday junction resolvase